MPIYLMVLFIRGVSFPANGLVFSQKRNQHSVKGAPSYNAWPTSPAGVGNFEGAPFLALFEKWGLFGAITSFVFRYFVHHRWTVCAVTAPNSRRWRLANSPLPQIPSPAARQQRAARLAAQ